MVFERSKKYMERHVTFLIFKNFATRREGFFSSVDDFKISKPIPGLSTLWLQGELNDDGARENEQGKRRRDGYFDKMFSSLQLHQSKHPP